TPSRLLACHDRPARLRPDHRHLLCGPAVPPPDPQARHHRRQVTPSIWTACHTARPNGVSTGTWLLILGELSCWLAFGLHQSDPRLLILGHTGRPATALIPARIRHTGNNRRRACGAAEPFAVKSDASGPDRRSARIAAQLQHHFP